MPKLERPDGVELHWEEQGEGPLVVICPHLNSVPEVFDPLIAELASDHRVVRYDARGTGNSTRTGPHDMETGADDLEAVLQAAGTAAVLIAILDACNRAVRVGARRDDLVQGVVGLAPVPIGRETLAGTESLAGSATVIDAFVEQMENDYRGALRAMLTAANPQMSEDELRRRVQRQADYCPRGVAPARLRAWVEDDATGAGCEMEGRLWLLLSPDMAGPWFPSVSEMLSLLATQLPDAHAEEIADGIVSRPDLTAAVVRRLTAPLRAVAR